MEKCPKCAFRKVRKVVDRDPDNPDLVIAVASICKNCGHILREKTYREKK